MGTRVISSQLIRSYYHSSTPNHLPSAWPILRSSFPKVTSLVNPHLMSNPACSFPLVGLQGMTDVPLQSIDLSPGVDPTTDMPVCRRDRDLLSPPTPLLQNPEIPDEPRNPETPVQPPTYEPGRTPPGVDPPQAPPEVTPNIDPPPGVDPTPEMPIPTPGPDLPYPPIPSPPNPEIPGEPHNPEIPVPPPTQEPGWTPPGIDPPRGPPEVMPPSPPEIIPPIV